MSIIYDALKKVEESFNKAPPVKLDKRHISRPKTYLMYTLIICVGFFIANIFFGLSTKFLKKSASVADKSQLLQVNIIQKETDLPSQTLEVSAETQKPLLPSLILNGVFFSENEGYALINNKIAKVGDVIEGATLKRITLEEVDLDFQGLEIKLSTGK